MQINEVIFAGFVGRDATSFTTKGGLKIISFSLAHSIKGKDGKEDKTTWLNCKVMNTYWADVAEMNVKKGNNVIVKGYLTINKYKGKDGAEKEGMECMVQSLGILSKEYAKDRYAQDVSKADDFFEEPPF